MKSRLNNTLLLPAIFLILVLTLAAGCNIFFPARLLNNTGTETARNDYDNSLSSAKNEDTTVKDEQNENFKNSKDSSETGENITVYPEKTGQDNLGANRIIQESREIIFNISYDIKLAGSTSKIEFISSIPKDYLRRQGIKAYSFSLPEPQLFYSGDNYYAKFIINNPKDNFLINIQTDMVIYEYSLGIASKSGSIIDKNPQNLQKYLKNENFIEKDDEAIIAVAQSFKNPDQVELVGEIYNFVLSNMEYSGYNPSSTGAVSALLEGKGDCTEYSDLFVALCRAKGIAARTVEGYTTDESIDYISLGHNWSEVFFDNYGWVPFDTIYDDNNSNSSSTTFYNLKNIYIYTGFERNDKILFNYHYYAYTYYGDNIEVNKKITVIEKNNG